MWIIKYKKIFYSISAIAVLLSIIFIFSFGLRPSIDFTGGSVLEFKYTENPLSADEVRSLLDTLDFENYVLRSTEGNGYLLKLQDITDEQREQIEAAIGSTESPIEVIRFSTIGPTLGKELSAKATVALIILSAVIILFIAFTFRQVSKPVSSWKYGVVAIIALLHDVIITVGAFALFGKFWGLEVDTLFVTALLVILGYSINDTIVVLDRVRENLRDKDDKVKSARFAEIVGRSLDETFARSLNTSISTLLALIALLVIGAESIHSFTIALIIGIVSGAYSSLFVAAPMIIDFKSKAKKPIDS